MLIADLLKKGDSGSIVDPAKVAQGFATLLLQLMEHAPELAMLALAAYADFSSGNLPALANVTQQAVPIIKEIGGVK